MHLKSVYAIALLIVALSAQAQQQSGAIKNGDTYGDTVKIKKTEGKYYNPKVAARRSAMIPGWGQIYNDSWWKVPILYGGFGTAIYFIYFNDDRYHFFKTELAIERAKDPQDQNANRIRVFSRNADAWRRNRDLVVLTMVGIYGLQIIDATVDAHLKGFNVDDNLSLNLKPKFGVINDGTPFIGMKLTLPIGK